MSRHDFIQGTRFIFDAEVYVVKEVLLSGKVVLLNQTRGGEREASHRELTELWSANRLVFEALGERAIKQNNLPIPTAYTIADFSQLEDKYRKVAWRRYRLIRPILDLPPEQRTRKAIDEYVQRVRAQQADTYSGQAMGEDDLDIPAEPTNGKRKRSSLSSAFSRGSIERWIRGFEESGNDIRALVPELARSSQRERDRSKTGINPEVEAIIGRVFDDAIKRKNNPARRRMRIHAVDLWLDVVNAVGKENAKRPADQQLTIPCEATVRRRIAEFGTALLLGRKLSRVEAQAHKSTLPGLRPTRVCQIIEMDDTDLDIIVVDDEDGKPIGRPTVTFAFELSKRMPYGMAISFRKGSYLTIAACLLHGILPKPDYRTIYELRNDWPVWGIPEEIIIDNGKHYIGKGLKDACAVLDIRITPLPGRTPWWKGHIERMFRTQNSGVLHSLPGTTKSNVADRGDYKSQKYAFIRYSRFIQLLLTFLLDDYAIKEHRALRDTPMNTWNTGVLENSPSLGRSAEEVHRLLCRQTKRLIRRTGISLEGLTYQSGELITLRTALLRRDDPSAGQINAVHRGRKKALGNVDKYDPLRVTVRYDEDDLGSVFVLDPLQDKWITVPCTEPEYANDLQLWKHRMLRPLMSSERRTQSSMSRAAARERMDQIVEGEYRQTKKLRTRARMAGYLGVGREHDLHRVHIKTIKRNNGQTGILPLPPQPVALPTTRKPSLPLLPAFATPPPSETMFAPEPQTQAQQPTGRKVHLESPKAEKPRVDAQPQAEELLDIDMDGWGGDYSLPSTKRQDQRAGTQ